MRWCELKIVSGARRLLRRGAKVTADTDENWLLAVRWSCAEKRDLRFADTFKLESS